MKPLQLFSLPQIFTPAQFFCGLFLIVCSNSVVNAKNSVNEISDQELALEQLHQARVLMFRAGREYLLHHITDYDPRFKKSTKQNLAKVETIVPQLDPLLEHYVEFPIRQELQKKWQQYQELQQVNFNTLDVMGEVLSTQLEELMKAHAQLLFALKNVYNTVEAGLEKPLQPLVSKSRHDTLLIESISFLYMSQIKSNTRPHFYEEGMVSMNVLCDRFESALAELRIGLIEDSKSRRQLKEVKIKFDFIEPSLRNVSERAVPELVNRYSKSIGDVLHRIEQRGRSKQT